MTLLILVLLSFGNPNGMARGAGLAEFYVSSTPADKNFALVDDFEKSSRIFVRDTFNLVELGLGDGEVITYNSPDKPYLVVDIWLFREMGKMHFTYWMTRSLDFQIVRRTDFKYDKPYYKKGYHTTETTEFYSFDDSTVARYDGARRRIWEGDNEYKSKEVRALFIQFTKGISINK